MENYDWTQFTQRIPVRSSAQEIYNAWATPSGLERWFLRRAAFKTAKGDPLNPQDFVTIGDNYEWNWFGWSDDTYERGTVMEANGNDTFRFSFGKAGIVTVTLKPEGNYTLVQLTQEQIPIDEKSRVDFHLGCSTGWTFYLANLKSILEGGLDLRNKDEKIRQVVNS